MKQKLLNGIICLFVSLSAIGCGEPVPVACTPDEGECATEQEGGFEIGLENYYKSLLSEFIEPISSIPIEGLNLKKNHCFYEISSRKNNGKTFVSISGRKLNASGESTLGGIEGIQQALLEAIYRGKPEVRSDLCESYGDILRGCQASQESVVGIASISYQCFEEKCPPRNVLVQRATDVAKIMAMDQLAKKLGVSVESIQAVENNRMKKSTIEVKSQAMLKNVQFSKPQIHEDEVHIEASAKLGDG